MIHLRPVSLAYKFQTGENPYVSSCLWDKHLTMTKCCSQVHMDPIVVGEITKGIRLGSQLGLPTQHKINHHHMASFVVNAKTLGSLAAIE